MVIEGGVCHTYLLMEFQEMDPQRGIYQEAYSWSLELCMDFAEIEIFGQMEMNFCMPAHKEEFILEPALHLAEYFDFSEIHT